MESWLLAGALAALMGQPVDRGGTEGAGEAQGQDKSRARTALRQACQADADRLCPDAGSGTDKAAVRCLAQKRDELQPDCLSALKHARRVQVFRRACGGDVGTLCSGIEPGSGRILSCLKQNEAQLTSKCREHARERASKKAGSDAAAVADEAAAEQQAGLESLEQELGPVPEEAPPPEASATPTLPPA